MGEGGGLEKIYLKKEVKTPDNVKEKESKCVD